MNGEDRRQVVFLDTNALHFMHLYLTYASSEDLYPFCPNDGSADEARERLSALTPKKFRDSLSKGLEVIVDLSTSDSQVEYSPVSELELIAARARGRAIEKAAKEGIPDRMWTRFYDEEICSRLNTEDLAEIGAGVESLSASLEKAGISVTVNNPGRTRDIFTLARSIGSLVYLGFADSVIYAGALVAEADYLVTFDKHLKKTVNRIRTGSRANEEIRKRLLTVMEKIILVDAKNVTLPVAKRRLPHGGH